MNPKKVDELLSAQMHKAVDEYFAGLGEHLLTKAQIMNYINQKGEIVVKKKISTFAVVFAMVLLLGSVALAAGLGVFGSFMGREDHELSDLRLEKLDGLAVTLDQTQEFQLPGEKKDDETGMTDMEKALNRLAGQKGTLTLHQGYCDGHRLYYSYTLKLEKPSETVFCEGKPTGVDWGLTYPGEYAETRLHDDGADGEIAKWLTDHEESFVVRDHISVGDGAWMDGDSLMIFDSDSQWLDDTTLQGYQEVRLPEGFEAGDSLDVELPVCSYVWFIYQDAVGMKEAYEHLAENNGTGTVFVPMTIPVTGKTYDLSGELKKDDYAVSADITVSEVDVFGQVTLTGVEGWLANGGTSGDALQDTTSGFIRDYQLVAGDEVLRNVEGGLSDIVDGRYTIGLRFDLPQNTDSLALRPLGAQDASDDIPLK